MIRHLQWIAGPLSFSAVLASDPSSPARIVIGSLLWMFLWWIFELVPLGVTALLPLVLFPILGVSSFKEVAIPYSSEVIFLFLGGFLMARALEKWNLHLYLTQRILGKKIHGPKSALLIFIALTGFLSMWISNTAAALMLLPLVTSLSHEDENISFKLQKALRLGVGYGASVGGIATIIGSPPNAIMVANAQESLGLKISFLQWMYFGLPLAILGCLILWIYLSYVAFQFPPTRPLRPLQNSTTLDLSGPQKRVLTIFCLTAGAWILRGFMNSTTLTDAGIALIAILILFSTPSHRGSKKSLLEIEDLSYGGWPILLLFGGGLALSVGLDKSGLTSIISEALQGLSGFSPFVVILALSGLLIALTEISSNTAVAAIFVPLGLGLGKIVGVSEQAILMTITMAASLSFMLPMATPPNAVIFSSGQLTIRDMVRVGFGLNILFCILISLMTYFWLPLVWNLP